MAKILRLFTRQEWLWLFLCALLLGNAGRLSSQFATFYGAIRDEFDSSLVSLTFVFSTFIVARSLSRIWMGWLFDRHDTRYILTLGTIIASTGIALSSLAQNVWQLKIFYGVVGGIGFGAFWSPLLAFIQRNFSNRRGLATALTELGSKFDVFLIGILLPYLLEEKIGWRIGFLALAAMAPVLLLPFAYFLRSTPPYEPNDLKASGNTAPVQKPGIISQKSKTLGEILKQKDFWIFFTAQFCGSFCLTVLLVHMVSYAIESGMKTDQISSTYIFGGIAALIGTIGSGILVDKVGGKRTLFIFVISLTVPIPLLLLSSTLPAFTLAATLVWLGKGGIGPIFPVLTRELFGTKHIGLLLGIIFLGSDIGSAVGAYLSSYLFDLKGTYILPFLLSFIVGLIALLLAWMLPDRKEIAESLPSNEGSAS